MSLNYRPIIKKGRISRTARIGALRTEGRAKRLLFLLIFDGKFRHIYETLELKGLSLDLRRRRLRVYCLTPIGGTYLNSSLK